ncbi:MAG: Crp/Fnr family transcriptional regulator [Raoultibacter sp.]
MMATPLEHNAILIPTEAFRPLKIAEYIDQGKKKKLFKGEAICTSADTIYNPYYFYIEQGQIKACIEREDGENVPILWRNAGNAFLAEYSGFASIGRYRAKFLATTDTVLFGFSQHQLYKFILEDPDLFYEYIYVCHMTFAQMGHRIANAGSQSSTQRFIMWLEKLCVANPPDKKGMHTITCSMTLRQISELLSVHVTTCTKVIAAFENEGIIKRTRTHIYVYDLEKLKSCSQPQSALRY